MYQTPAGAIADYSSMIGMLTTNADGTVLAMTIEGGLVSTTTNGISTTTGLHTFTFNPCTGQITNHRQISNIIGRPKIELSASGQYLYVFDGVTVPNQTQLLLKRYNLASTQNPIVEETVPILGNVELTDDQADLQRFGSSIYFMSRNNLTNAGNLYAILNPDAANVSNVNNTLVASFSTFPGYQFPSFPNFTSSPKIVITGITTPYCTGNTRTFTANSHGCTPTSYTWNVTPSGTGTGTTYTVNGGTINVTFGTATATTISVTATYPCGPVTSSITINNGITPIVSLATVNPTPPCFGGTSQILATSNVSSSFQWSTGFTNSDNTAPFTSQITTSSLISLTTFTVTVTSTGGGCTATNSITITPKPLPVVTISPNPVSICRGSSATLTASGTTGNTYNWSTTATTPAITVTPTATTVYTVTATGSNTCTTTASGTVTVNPTPTVNITTAGAHCVGNTNTIFTASGGGTYLWSQGSTTAAIIISNPTTYGNYRVTVTSSNGCTATSSRIIDQYDVDFSGVHCFSSAVFQVEAIFNTPNVNPSYTWSFNNNTVSTSSGVNITSTGSYSVVATDNLGCRATGAVNIPVCFVGNTSMLSNGNGLGSSSNIDETTALSNINSSTSFAINPNPTSGSFNLSIKMEEAQEIGVVIRDLTGRVLQERQLGKVNDSNYLFDLAGYPAGMYLLSVHGEQGQLSVMKLIKE